jgi:hypothetical protein
LDRPHKQRVVMQDEIDSTQRDTASNRVVAHRADVVRAVVSLARRARWMHMTAAVATLLILIAVGGASIALLDALIRFPSILRAIMLFALLVFVAIDVRKFLVPAFRFRPRPIEIAQRIERQRPELAGHLAAAVDFELRGIAETNELAAYAVRNAEDMTRGTNLGAVLRLQPTLARVAVMFGCITAIVGGVAYSPTSAAIAVKRVLLPWSDAEWPARTGVESLVSDGLVAPKGTPLALRAQLTKGDSQKERVYVRYRVLSNDTTDADFDAQLSGRTSTGREQPWVDVAMSRQPNGEFERLIDVDGDRLEFMFVTRDAETEVRSVRLVEPPRVVAARAVVQPPVYAQTVMTDRVLELGDGTDSRAAPKDSILRGSEVVLELELSRPLGEHLGNSGDQGAPRLRSVAMNQSVEALGDSRLGKDSRSSTKDELVVDSGESPDRESTRDFGQMLAVEGDAERPTRWIARFPAKHSKRVEVDLVDSDGIRQIVPSAFVFDVNEDRSPSAAIILPAQDESVLADAKVPLRGDFRDDLELRVAGIEIAQRVAGQESESLVQEEVALLEKHANAGSLERILEVDRLRVSAGDVVVLRAFAEDFFTGDSEATENHGRARSAPRLLRIVGEEEFERQIRSSFSGVRREAMRSDARQESAREELEGVGEEPDAMEVQRSVTEGLGRMRDSLRGVAERLRRNQRSDGSLGEVARQAEEIAATAEIRSTQALEALKRAQDSLERATSPSGEPTRDATSTAGGSVDRPETKADAAAEEMRRQALGEAARFQEEVRAELEDLVGLLDRDEDAWVVRRRLDALSNRIQQLIRETEQAAQRSQGESRDDLEPEVKSELDALAERQTKTADEAERTLSEMKERSRQLADADPDQARSLDAAAKAAEEGQVREAMRQAARETTDNRLGQSRVAQERALEALSRAANELEAKRKIKAQELARLLEDLVVAIKRLITETEELRQRVAAIDVTDLKATESDRDSIALLFGRSSQNARGIAADARARSRESTRSARSIDQAAASMASTARELRDTSFDQGETLSMIDAALARLAEALREAQSAADRADDRAMQEKQEELVGRYRGLLERQVTLRESTARIAPQRQQPLGRREVVESRRLGATQESIREAILQVLQDEAEVRDSEVLVDIHAQIDDLLKVTRASLLESRPADALPASGEAIDLLSSIVESLSDELENERDDPFEEQQSAGSDGGTGGAGEGGGPSGSPVVPPVAEVKMLRSLQAGLARRTRELDESGLPQDSVSRVTRLAEIAARQQRVLELATRLAEKIRSGGSAARESGENSDPNDESGRDNLNRSRIERSNP